MNAILPAPAGKLDETLAFTTVRIAVMTISDTRDEESDTSGALLASRVAEAGHELAGRAVVRDGWDKVIRWQLDSRHRPCNMVELMPRLLET